MKRSPQLRDLSEQHHYGLVAARRLRLAAEGKEPLEEALSFFTQEWEREISAHFAAEEEVLLPAFAQVAGGEQPLIARTLAEHAGLREAVSRIGSAEGEERRKLAGEIGTELHDHIRFEERVLFPEIEAALSGLPLEELGCRLQQWERRERVCTLRPETPS